MSTSPLRKFFFESWEAIPHGWPRVIIGGFPFIVPFALLDAADKGALREAMIMLPVWVAGIVAYVLYQRREMLSSGFAADRSESSNASSIALSGKDMFFAEALVARTRREMEQLNSESALRNQQPLPLIGRTPDKQTLERAADFMAWRLVFKAASRLGLDAFFLEHRIEDRPLHPRDLAVVSFGLLIGFALVLRLGQDEIDIDLAPVHRGMIWAAFLAYSSEEKRKYAEGAYEIYQSTIRSLSAENMKKWWDDLHWITCMYVGQDALKDRPAGLDWDDVFANHLSRYLKAFS